MGKAVNIIGGGVGGLISAALLAKNGVKVTLFEKRPEVGGAVGSFTRKGYNFEATTHQLASLDSFRYLYRELGLETRFAPLREDALYDIFYIKDSRLEKKIRVPAGPANYSKWLMEQFPGEKREIKSYLKTVAGIYNDMERFKRLGFASNPIIYLYDALTALMLKKGKEGSLARAIGKFSYRQLIGHFNETQGQFLRSFSLSQPLKSLLSQYSLYLSATPEEVSADMMAIVSYSYVVNSPFLFREGSHRFVSDLTGVIKDNGGQIKTSTPISRIEVEGDIVKAIYDEEGNRYEADYTLSNSTLHQTFLEMIGEEKVADHELIEKIKSLKPANSCFSVYVGLPAPLSDYGFDSQTAFFNYSADADRAFARLSPAEDSVMLFSDYSYLNKDRSKSSFVILGADDYNLWKDIPYKSDQYRAFKKEREELLLRKFEAATGIPVWEKAELIFSASPLTYKHYMSNRQGEMLGLKLTPDQVMSRRVPVTTPFKNLFLTGHYIDPCGGVSGVLINGVAAAKAILKER